MIALEMLPLTDMIFRHHTHFGVGDISGSFNMPPVSTIVGALRTAIGNALDVDWSLYVQSGERDEIYDLIGDVDGEPPFAVSFPYLIVGNTPMIKMPFNVIVAEQGKEYAGIFIPFETEIEDVPFKLTKLIDMKGKKPLSGDVYISLSAIEKLYSEKGHWVKLTRSSVEGDGDFVVLSDVLGVFFHTGIKIDRSKYTVFRGKQGGYMFRYKGIEYLPAVKIGAIVVGDANVLEVLKKLAGKEIFVGAKGGVAYVNVEDVPFPLNKASSKVWILYSPMYQTQPPFGFDDMPSGVALQGKYIITGYNIAERDGKPTKISLPPSSVFFFEGGYNGKSKSIFITL